MNYLMHIAQGRNPLLGGYKVDHSRKVWVGGEHTARSMPLPVPRDKWPAWAVFLEMLRNDEDKGVGDTFKRKLGLAGKVFERAAAAMGVPCRCPQKREELNARYPYRRTWHIITVELTT